MYPIDYLWRAAAKWPERIAVHEPNGAVTYSQLRTRVVAAGTALLKFAKPQPYVAIAASDTIEHLVTLLAVLAAGKIWIPLNPRLGDGELSRILKFVGEASILVDAGMAARMADMVPTAIQITDITASSDLADENALPMGPVSKEIFSRDRAQAIKFTGGTTGVAKGVIQPLRSWMANIVTQMYELELCETDRYLVSAPLTHGTSTYILPILGRGGSLIFPETNSASGLLDAAQNTEATLTFAPPTRIYDLIDEQVRSPRRLTSLRYLIYGGAPMPRERIREAQAVFGRIIGTCYGQTEAPQIITFMPPSELVGDRITSVGRATIMTRIMIVSTDGRAVPPGGEGQIAVRGELVMSGYLEAEVETNDVLRDGWLLTGDLGLVDEAGYLFLRDRLRNVVISGGFNIYPTDVEHVLASHPEVADCSVFGIPDKRWGEIVHAAIQRRPGATVTADELIQFVKHDLGSIKAPKQIHFFDQLPRSSVGKVLKREIKDLIMNASLTHISSVVGKD